MVLEEEQYGSEESRLGGQSLSRTGQDSTNIQIMMIFWRNETVQKIANRLFWSKLLYSCTQCQLNSTSYCLNPKPVLIRQEASSTCPQFYLT